MRLGRRQERNKDAHIDMTSMLDIVFIMLIFFIVTSSFVHESGVEVNRPTVANATNQKNVTVFIAVTANNQIYIDKRLVDVERVQATLESLVLDKPDVSVVIQADKFAFNGTVVEVMDGVKSAGVEQVALATDVK